MTSRREDEAVLTGESDIKPGHHSGHDHHHESTHESGHHHHHDHGGCCGGEAAPLNPLSGPQAVADGISTPIRIMAMDCPTEEAMIRKKLGGVSAVKRLEFNLMQRILTVVHAEGELNPILEAIRSLGFEPEVPEPGGQLASVEEKSAPLWPLGLSLVAAVASAALHWLGANPWLVALLAVAAVLICGSDTYKKGWVAVRNGNLNINALMSVAVTGAMALGQWPEAAMVMVLFNVAELIEAKSLDRARNAIHGLMKLAPETATVQRTDGSWQTLEVSEIGVGERVRVRPGERVGLDGEIIQGRSSINQGPITGESMPVDKGPGDEVFAGTINGDSEFEYQVRAGANNTVLSRIIHAVEAAQGAKAPTQRFVDRFARVYTPIVFALAVAIALVPPLILGGGWAAWIYKALVLLVIACPCALVISTPVTVVSGLAAAARKGILIKGGVYLESGRNLTRLVLDKTGTLTQGKPVQTDFEAFAGASPEQIRRIAASLTARSDHPVSQAIAQAAQKAGFAPTAVTDFEALPGQGVRGRVDGERYAIGNHRLMHELELCTPSLEERLRALEADGKTVVGLMNQGRIMALFAVADTVKATSREAIAELHKAGIKTLMLSGDNQKTAEAIARQVGIDEARGDQLPEDKLRAVEEFTRAGPVGMVGDGINDAPALARADIGFAMGAMGTDTAIETADVALMDDDLGKIPLFIRLSRTTRSILVQNITAALAIKVIFIALTLAGMGTMWMAVFADVGASLLVVANGLRLVRH